MAKAPRFVYTGIRVSNLKRSVNFYKRAFGMNVVRSGTMPHGGKYVGLRNPKSKVEPELNWYPKSSKFYTPFKNNETLDHLAFAVGKNNVEKAFNKLVVQIKIAKAAVTLEEAKGVCDPYILDPDGNWIELVGWD